MTGRQRRRQYEWEQLRDIPGRYPEIGIRVTAQDADGIPTEYEVRYLIRSICGIDEEEKPLFADSFTMRISLPAAYPQVDAPPEFRFVGETHPWHPNIRYYGEMSGIVCLNQLNTFTDLAWGVERVRLYLRYELYHAMPEPPYPEDLRVAAWVRQVGEKNGYVFFDQDDDDDDDDTLRYDNDNDNSTPR